MNQQLLDPLDVILESKQIIIRQMQEIEQLKLELQAKELKIRELELGKELSPKQEIRTFNYIATDTSMISLDHHAMAMGYVLPDQHPNNTYCDSPFLQSSYQNSPLLTNSNNTSISSEFNMAVDMVDLSDLQNNITTGIVSGGMVGCPPPKSTRKKLSISGRACNSCAATDPTSWRRGSDSFWYCRRFVGTDLLNYTDALIKC